MWLVVYIKYIYLKNKEGKISKVLDTHLIEAILIKNNIWVEFTEYFKPVYRYQSPTGKNI